MATGIPLITRISLPILRPLLEAHTYIFLSECMHCFEIQKNLLPFVETGLTKRSQEAPLEKHAYPTPGVATAAAGRALCLDNATTMGSSMLTTRQRESR